MSIQLNHTIVHSHDKHASAAFLAAVLGLEPPREVGHFVAVDVANGVSLDFDNATEIRPQHYAFLIDESDFDPIFARVQERRIEYYAYPGHQNLGEINTRRGGRGFYFDDPSGHAMEVFTPAALPPRPNP